MHGVVTATREAGCDMTVQMLNTKAEQAILKTFEDNAARLPGEAALKERRRAAIGAFASKGLPSRRVEEFKYTDLKASLKDAFPLAKGGTGATDEIVRRALGPHFGSEFQTGVVAFSDGRGLNAGDGASLLAGMLSAPPDWVARLLADEALNVSSDLLVNSALFTDGAVINVAADAKPDQPIVIVSAAGGQEAEAMVALRHIIRIGKGAKVTLVEVDTTGRDSARQSSAVSQVEVGEGAEVHHIKIVALRKGSSHLGHWQVALGANATYRPFQLTLGEGLARNSIGIAFNGQHSIFDYGAASIVHGQGHADSTLVIDHRVPHCTSRELFKAVLDGQARGVFQGKVIVQPDAQKTDGKQMAQALMLSPDAEFDSKPELEIYADDVVCGHGSTVAEIDPDLVFYCTSRGIPQATARALLIESFIGEAIDKVEHEVLREAIRAMAQDSLAV